MKEIYRRLLAKYEQAKCFITRRHKHFEVRINDVIKISEKINN